VKKGLRILCHILAGFPILAAAVMWFLYDHIRPHLFPFTYAFLATLVAIAVACVFEAIAKTLE
jgi:hypothetical protein